MEVLVDIPIHTEGQRSTQFSHDLKGLQIPSQRFQRAHMEDRPPGFIKLSSQIAVDVNALGAAIIDTGVTADLVGGQLYLLVSASLVLTGQHIVQNGFGFTEVSVFLCQADSGTEQTAASVP